MPRYPLFSSVVPVRGGGQSERPGHVLLRQQMFYEYHDEGFASALDWLGQCWLTMAMVTMRRRLSEWRR